MGSKISTHGAGPGPGDSDDEDRISILPDHLLQHILSFIPAQDAVRTGVLSRRWQHVWVEAPTFAFSDDTRSTAGFADSLEKVLARSRSHHVDVLKISIRHPLHMAHANVWLQQAVERVHGSTGISFVFPPKPNDCSSESSGDRVVLDLPCGGRTTALSLDVSSDGIGTLRVPPVSAALSSSLTELSLKSLRLDGSRFSDFVSSCCPHLRKLFLHTFGGMDYLRLSNDALEDLDLDFASGSCRGLRQLQVSSRNLRRLRIHDIFVSFNLVMVMYLHGRC
ncbi:putative F-box protein At1g49610 [Triticum aestivum]|uniref:putative F-box protein At1g49610 n=1 Tax=Triticum aestivum TaxID=4565 RepID=UPI000844855C|nr:putative F-box protein At1g49610 [Triticum aestivum]